MKVKKSFFLVGTQIFDYACASRGILFGPTRDRLPALTSCLPSFELRDFRPELL